MGIADGEGKIPLARRADRHDACLVPADARGAGKSVQPQAAIECGKAATQDEPPRNPNCERDERHSDCQKPENFQAHVFLRRC